MRLFWNKERNLEGETRMRKRYSWLLLVVIFALVAASCSSSSDDTTTTAGSATEDTTPSTETTAAPAATTTSAADTGGEILTDVGVDLEAGTITLGMLSDLSGPFAGLVGAINGGHEAYWAFVNANGGIDGLQVELEVVDTGYAVPEHVTLYEQLKDQVVAFGSSVGSPHTVAIYEDLVEDGILAIPLTWYSGWTSPFDANTMHHGSPYCIEAMNVIDYVSKEIDAKTIAIASVPGDYGLDSAAGAAIAADLLGLEVVYDATGQIIPGEDGAPIGVAIAESGADLVWVTGSSGTFPPVYGAAIATGFEAAWSGAFPTYSPAYLGSDFAEQIVRDYWGGSYLLPWGGDSPGNELVREVMTAAGADPLDYYGEGFVEAQIMEQALRAAYASGDMTQAGVLAAAKTLESVDFGGLAPAEKYTGTPNEQLNRVTVIQRPSLEDIAAGGTGSIVIDPAYTSQIAADYDFQSACFEL
jgi:ABC-type branched-subunit amino acid transport system substrate-binding protein